MILPESGTEFSADQQLTSGGDGRMKLLPVVLLAFVLGYLLLPGAACVFTEPDSAGAGLLAAMGPLLSIAVVILGVRGCSGSWRNTWENLDLRRLPGRKFVFWSLPLALLIAIAGGAVTCLWEAVGRLMNWQFEVPPTLEIILSGEHYQIAALFFTALLAAPVFEEIFFRKALFEFMRNFIGHWGAMAVSASCFAAVHISLLQLPGLFMFACIWQYFYCRSQSLWSSIILHFFNNLLSVCLLWSLRNYGGELVM